MMKISYHLIRAFILWITLIFIVSACNTATLQQKIIPVKNGQLAYYQFGHGSPIVLITGYAATLSEWNNTFLETLARTHQVIVFDNRGVGHSQFSTTDYRIKDLANDTAQLISHLHLNKPTVLGWSMGGMIAQKLAIEHPELIGKLVLMGTTIGGKEAIPTSPSVEKKLTDHSGTKTEKFNRIMSILFPVDIAPTMAKKFEHAMFKPQNNLEPSIPVEIVKKQKIILLNWKKTNEISRKLKQLQIPTLILTGTDDVIIPPKNAEVLAHTIPNAQLVEIKHGGHAMMYQYPIEIAQIINHFIYTNYM